MTSAIFHISGRVQGVSFRAGARARALRLGIRGHARNLRDGRVEVVAEGDAAAIDALEHWLRQGPIGARVEALERAPFTEPVPSGFYTR